VKSREEKDPEKGPEEPPETEQHAEYRSRLEARRTDALRLATGDRRLSGLRLLTFAIIVAAGFLAFGTHHIRAAWLAAPVVLFGSLLFAHDRVIRRRSRAERAVAFYERGLARLEDRWAGAGCQRQPSVDATHAFAADLDLFGQGSLFELLCDARTPAGEDKLASWLLAPAGAREVRERQAAVDELRNRLDLREDLCLLGDPVRTQLDSAALIRWGSQESPAASALPRTAAALATGLSFLGLALAIKTDAGLIPLLVALTLQGGIAMGLRRRVRGAIQSASDATRDLALLSGLLARLERETGRSPRLAALRGALESEGLPPSRRIAELQRLVDLLDARRNQFFAPIGALLLWGTHLGLAIERWRAQHGPALERWLDAVAEIEALASLAAYAYEHPLDPFPEIDETAAVFDGRGLGHPLLPASQCVRNDVRLVGERQVYMVSGSNMSGKSTLLRTVGVNAVLALAGAPVRADSLRLSPLALGASIRVLDSLQTGTSHFYAEIKRLRQILDLTADGQPVLFLLDEVLHGTNSHDRRIGAEAVLRTLLDRRTLGLVTTHDLALARVADELAPRVENVHFQDQLSDGRMSFDYCLWPGVVSRSNALELMRSVGLEV
jgi:hypothetical protein